jgi:putative transposase
VKDLEKTNTCAFQANYHLIWATKYRRKVLLGLVEVRLLEVLKMVADEHGYRLLAARVYEGDHVHVFVSAPPKVSIPEMVRVFKCVSAKVLFEEFAGIKLYLWVGICGQVAMRLELQASLPVRKSNNTQTEFSLWMPAAEAAGSSLSVLAKGYFYIQVNC